jgi:hypothetical protein
MLDMGYGVEYLVQSPLILLLILFAVSHPLYVHFFRRIAPEIASGSIVMALGIVALACLPQFHFSSFTMLVVAMEVIIIWFYLAVKLVQSGIQGDLRVDHASDRIGMGTWVAGTSTTAILLDHAEQTLHGFIVFLGIIALVLYLIYFIFISQWFVLCIKKKFHLPVNGMVSLATVSTQSIVLLLAELFRDDIPTMVYFILILMGLIFYFVGAICILRHFFQDHRQHLLAGWSNSNVINHGALSITGLAMLNSKAFSEWMIVAVWWGAAIFFLIIELLESGRFLVRIRMRGIRSGVFVYHTSQWTRVFTFGMLYAFTLTYYSLGYPSNLIVEIIANYGQYFVACLACVQVIVAMFYVLKQERKP